jgi:acyl carrier protein
MAAVQRGEVEEAIRSFLKRSNKTTEFTDETVLHGEGLGLDSLETAELSAVLEDTFDIDPFTESTPPETVGEILAFYDRQLAPEG